MIKLQIELASTTVKVLEAEAMILEAQKGLHGVMALPAVQVPALLPPCPSRSSLVPRKLPSNCPQFAPLVHLSFS